MDDEAKCPFCRVPMPKSNEELIEMNMKRAEMDDAEAIYNLGCFYNEGRCGLSHDSAKALEFWHRAAELGNATAYYSIGYAYDHGEGVEHDTAKAKHYWELAAVEGRVNARYNLGWIEERAGNVSRALRHFMIATGCGHDNL